MSELLKFTVDEEFRRLRLDEFLFNKISAVSRIYLRNLIAGGKCTVNNCFENKGYKLKTGDAVEIEVDVKATTSMLPENIPLEILYEDEDLIVVSKSPEILVHPTKGVKSGTLLNALSYHINVKNKQDSEISVYVRPGLVHRLDRKTSGLLVISKHAESHRKLSNHFQRKLVKKFYFALVEGLVESDNGKISAGIAKDETDRFWFVSDEGKSAETNFKVLKRFDDSTLLELEPVTGRTNQLRLHCRHIGHSVIGDDLYGGRTFPRLCLHAYRLEFNHPKDNRQMVFETDLPKDFFRE